MVPKIRFHTNIDCAQRLVAAINAECWCVDGSPMPLIGDYVEVFNESRKGRDPATRVAKMIVATRSWKKGVLYVYLDIDPMWAKLADIESAKDDKVTAYTLFERWIKWELTENELKLLLNRPVESNETRHIADSE